jgi:hypothetical protein
VKAFFAVLMLLLAVTLAQPVTITKSLKMGTTPALWLMNGQASLSTMANSYGHNVNFSQENYYNYLLPTTTSTYYAQSINQSYNYEASGVVLTIATSGVSFPRSLGVDPIVRLETNNGSNLPSGILVNANATATVSRVDVVGNSYSGVGYLGKTAFIFTNPVPLVAGTKYWIVVRPGGTGSYEYNALAYYNVDNYTTGAYTTSTNAGGSWAAVGTNDLMFYVLTAGKDNSSIAYDTQTRNATLGTDWFIDVDGTGELRVDAGETLNGASGAHGRGQLVRVGNGGGGIVSLIGNATNYVNIYPTGAFSKGYLVTSVYMGRVQADFLNATGNTSSGMLYINAVYGQLKLRNSRLVSSHTATTLGYPIYIQSVARESLVVNNTFYKPASTYVFVVGTGTTDVTIMNNWLNGSVNYAYPFYVGTTIPTGGARFIDNYYAKATAVWSDIVPGMMYNVYVSTGYIYGHVVKPLVLSGGVPVAGAYVTVATQFDSGDLPNMQYGFPSQMQYGVAWNSSVAYQQASNGMMRSMTAYTDANGYPVDDLGLSTLYTASERRMGLGVAPVTVRFDGSNSSLRPYGYSWRNDGTDYGYLLTAGTPALGAAMVVMASNATYSANVTIGVTPTAVISFANFSFPPAFMPTNPRAWMLLS